MVTAAQLQGQFHGGLGALWAQFYVQSDSARAAGIAEHIPSWVAPRVDEDGNDILATRSLLHWEWLPALALIAFTMLIGRIDNMILGYGLFRLTSDIEKLPFPMAPVQAQGVMALSEEQVEESARKGSKPDDEPEPHTRGEPAGSWRWRIFSIGAVMGLVFGAIYLGVPTITGALLDAPIEILPIPFVDYTQKTSEFLPAVASGISLNLGRVIFGMVLPFWAVVGSFVGLVVTFVANPILHDPSIVGSSADPILSSWNRGDNMQVTFYKNQVDFYFSFSVGVAIAIALMGFWSVFRAYTNARREARERGDNETAGEKLTDVPEGRGDIRPWIIIAVYLLSTALYIGVSCWLLFITDGAVFMPLVLVMCIYAFFYTPLISYVTARLEGIAGEVLNIPFVREASFILSGYNGIAVWFLPIPLHNYGSMTVFYRSCELTGTKFWSHLEVGNLPHPDHPDRIAGLCPLHLATRRHPRSQLPLRPGMVGGHRRAAIAHFLVHDGRPVQRVRAGPQRQLHRRGGRGRARVASSASRGSAPRRSSLYGVVKGLNQTLPFTIIPEFIGALIGRYYFQKKYGLQWRQYIPRHLRRLLLRHGPGRHPGRRVHVPGQGGVPTTFLASNANKSELTFSLTRHRDRMHHGT